MDIPNKFCHNCGSKQTSVAAKFCFNCGTSLASIDERPPQAAPAPSLGRVQQQPRPAETFEPSVLGGRHHNDEDDDTQIRADRVESLAELGIRMNDLDIVIDMPRILREDFNNVVRSGAGLPANYHEAARASADDDLKRILGEGAAIRPSASTEIK